MFKISFDHTVVFMENANIIIKNLSNAFIVLNENIVCWKLELVELGENSKKFVP
jgi:hypothetical protein